MLIGSKSFKTPVFLHNGFRPFFLGAALVALFNMVIWIGYLAGSIEIPSLFSGVKWHLHEMMFGFVGAAVAGFLLTAVPNWTGRPPLKGANLLSLFALWLLGRIVVFYSQYTGIYFAALADLPFFFILSLYIFREIMVQGNKRNIPIAILIFLFGIANMLTYLELLWGDGTAQYGTRFAIMLIAILIMLIGGRVIPNFTANWLRNKGSANMPIMMNRFDLICIFVGGIALGFWVGIPDSGLTGIGLIFAGILNGIRLSRWRIKEVLKKPILLVLQIAYGWLVIGLFLLGLFILLEVGSQAIPIHIISVGAFSAMIVAIMTRASLGHTGRKIQASYLTIAVYLFINISVILRIFAPAVDALQQELLYFSGWAWILAFVLFIFQYAPYYFSAHRTK